MEQQKLSEQKPAQKASFFRRFRHFWQYDLIPCLSVMILCAFPCIYIYCRNADEAVPVQMLPFLLVFLATAALIMLVSAPFLRNVSREAFLADLSMLVVINFTMLSDQLKAVLPWFDSKLLLGLFLLLLLALFLLLLRKKPDLRAGCLLILIAFAAVTVMNTALAIPDILSSISAQRAQPELAEEADTGITLGNPQVNVYYLLLDEYGGYENLLHYYNYDNSAYLDALEARGFTVTRECRNPESVMTDTLIPNLLNLDYKMKTGDYGVMTDYYMENSLLVRLFQQNGYQVNLVNHLDFIGSEGCNVLTQGQTKSTLSKYLLENSLYQKITPIRHWLCVKFRISSSQTEYAQLENALEAGRGCAAAAQPGPTFTICYWECPHSPLLLQADGSHIPWTEHFDWADPSLYLGQLQYMSDYTLELIDSIQAADPDALIILQSDHGCRLAMHEISCGLSDWYDPEEENPYMWNILNCVYYQGQRFDIEGTTGINTIRRTLNQVFGTDLPDLEPVYSYFNYSESLRKSAGLQE